DVDHYYCCCYYFRFVFRRTRRSVWLGEYHRLVEELKLDGSRFKEYFRMSRAQFEVLLQKIGPSITRRDTNYREAISSEERLSICLRYLSTGDSFRSIAFSYRVGYCTVARIVKDVCEAIWSGMVQEYMPFPEQHHWKKIAEDFHRLWNFPNCLGAIDGKHVAIQAPSSTGSMYYNYKGSFSIVLLAVVDARYLFRMVDVGAYGKSSDGGTLCASDFGKALHQGTLDLPEDAPLPGAEDLQPVPHVFVGDEAFPLKKNLLRPYPGKHLDREKHVFNYRLSPKGADAVVKATCILHNFLRFEDAGEEEGSCVPLPLEQQLAMQPIQRVGSNNASREALEIRQRYTTYFSSPAGEVAWQHSVL
uniref:Zgc:194221 n=1 Tax=Sinocyclocheilus anshuiensis TaxID=1608454 RepID=A0A671RVC8_9TELE